MVASVPELEKVIAFPVSVPLYAHQRHAAALACHLPYAALLCEQGTGKTLATIAAIGHLWQCDQIRSALIVCPKSVLGVWQAELCRATFPYYLATLDGSLLQRLRDLECLPVANDRLRIAIINYEGLIMHRGTDPAMERALSQFVRGGIMILDESQRIKAPGGRQSWAAARIGRHAARRLILTGTPTPHSPLDIYAQYRFLNPRVFGTSFVAFRNRYAVMGGFEGHEVVKWQNLNELTAKMHSIAYRVTRAECLDLPPETEEDVPFMLESRARKIYDALRDAAIARLNAQEQVTASNVLVELLRLQQVCGGFVRTDEGTLVQTGREKLDTCLDLLDDLLTDRKRKVVVFCRFLAEISALVNALRERGIAAAELTGQTEHRASLVEAFQREETTRVLVVQVQTGGLGITLHRADTAIWYSSDWSYGNYEQGKARLQRIGQTAQRVLHLRLIARNTIESKLYHNLATKRDLAEVVSEGWRDLFDEKRGN